jgi:16S rRNA U1498 N3-methylase RsmE
MRRAILCRALNTHAWVPIGNIVVLPHDERRVTFQCDRCDSIRIERWKQTGHRASPRYKRPKNYQDLLEEFDSKMARAEFLDSRKPVKLKLVSKRAS